MPQATLGSLSIRFGEERHEFTLTEPITAIGRAPDNTLVLADAKVSRYHARLEIVDGRFMLVDLGSANGSQLNGDLLTPKQPRQVRDGDTLTIGDYQLRVSVGASPVVGADGRPPLLADSRPALTTAPPQAILPLTLSGPRLIVRTSGASREVALDRDALTLGRDPAGDIVIDDPAVAPKQATLQRAPDGYQVTNAGNAGSLRYLDAPLSQRVLEDGDVLWIGSEVSLTYRAPADILPVPRVDLRNRAQISLGRATPNDVFLPHPAISRQHARLTRRDGSFVIEDLESSNGTFLNGTRLAPRTPAPLAVGDNLRLGPFKFYVTAEALEQSDESRDLRLDALHLGQPLAQGRNLLQDISFAILPREFVAILGPNGAGKSTLLGALTGMRPARQGAVLVNDTDLYRRFDALRGLIGYLPQDDIVHAELTVAEALDYAAQLRLPADTTPEERTQRVDQVLRTLTLTERRNIPIAQLNRGQRKRVSIGVELLSKPGLFFLDEATFGLDPGTESQFMRLLRQLADSGHTIVLVTHGTKNLMLCDMVAFMAGGYLVFYGPPAEALGYFGVKDFDGIYEQLQNELNPSEWAKRFQSSPQYHAYVAARLVGKYGTTFDPAAANRRAETVGAFDKVSPGMKPAPAAASSRPAAPPPPTAGTRSIEEAGPRVSALRQFGILSARYSHIISRERFKLLFLFIIAPLIGAIDLIAWPRRILDLNDGDASRSITMLFMAAISAFVVGALTNVREIVKEAPIYHRERMVVLRIVPYLLSKVWVALLFAFYHAAMLLLFKWLAVDFGALPATAIAQLYVMLVLAVLCGSATGLLVSALARREEQAVLLIIGVIAAHIVFSGGLLPLDRLGPVGMLMGHITSTKWAYEGAVAAVQLRSGNCDAALLDACRLPGILSLASDPERRVLVQTLERNFGSALHGSVAVSALALVLLLLLLYFLLWVAQKRKDPV